MCGLHERHNGRHINTTLKQGADLLLALQHVCIGSSAGCPCESMASSQDRVSRARSTDTRLRLEQAPYMVPSCSKVTQVTDASDSDLRLTTRIGCELVGLTSNTRNINKSAARIFVAICETSKHP